MRRWSARIMLVGYVALGSTSTYALAEGSGILVAGNERVEADTIRSYFHAGRTNDLDAADLDAGLKDLYATELFSDVRISHRDGRILVTVVENPLIARIAFEGNTKLKTDDLKKAVGSKERGPLSRAQVQKDVASILDLYHGHVRFDAHVDPKLIEAGDHRVNLVFEIQEGPRTGVRQVLFAGNSSFSATQLSGAVKTGQTNLLSFLLDNDLYDASRLEADRDSLRRFYLTHGYADVRVSSPVAQYDPEKKGFVVTFNIDEGLRYRIGRTDITSETASVDAASLRGDLAIHPGDTYNVDVIEKRVSALMSKLAGRGQPFATVHVKADRVPGGNTIDLRYTVEEGARVYVERIQIHGNTKTHDNVIRREFDFAEGDAYNASLAARAERRLKNLGYFKSVTITKQPGSVPDRAIVDVAVEEQDTGNFSIAGGYSSSDGLIAEITVSERNFMGRGEFVKASVSYGQYAKGFDLAFTEPDIFGSRASFGSELYGKQTTANTNQSFDTATYGGKLTVGLPLNEQLGAQWSYSLYRQSLTLDPAMGTASLPIQDAAAAGPTWVSAIGTGVTYSTLDNNRDPTSGWRASLNEEFAGLGGDAKFSKTTDDVRYYQPIADGVVGMVRGQSGYVAPWGGQPLPLLAGFFGGPQLVRGFATNGFGPRDVTPGTTMDNVGGNIYWATSAELQTAIPFIPPDAGLKAAFFADAGSLFRTSSSASSVSLSGSLVSNPQTIRSSLGAGLVWNSILGPIRVDYAYPTSQASTDITQRFRFSAGGF
jgi:outer membrane protein insertion porin family